MLKFGKPCQHGLLGGVLLGLAGIPSQSQELIYQENFNTDGAGTRYTIEGGEVYEVDRIRNELGIQDQVGPIYWARSSEISFVGVPGPTPERRALLTWHHNIDPFINPVSDEFLDLFESTVDWLTQDKSSGTVLWSAEPFSPGDFTLMNKLTEMGFTHQTDFDITQPLPAPDQVALVIKTSAGDGGNPGRFSSYEAPMLAYNAADYDDELIGSIGQSAQSLEIPTITIATNHPAAGGVSGSLPFLSGGAAAFDTIGDLLPENATVLATYEITTPFVVNTLERADQIIAGTLQSTRETNTIATADIADFSTGIWFYENPVPGTPTDTYALRGTGTIRVTEAGTYRFALGVDDGGRLRIDKDRNGFADSDNVVVMDSTGAMRTSVGNVQLSAAGTYDFEFVMFDQGGDAGVEISVANDNNAATDLVEPPFWEMLGDPFGTAPVTLEGEINVVAFSPTVEPETETRPFLVLLPGGSEGGVVLSGGPFVGYEGTGFFAGAGINKWPLPPEQDRTVRLEPIDVAGRTDLYLTIAAAGTFLDFERSTGSRGSGDYLEVWVDPDAAGAADFERLIHFTAPTGADKYFDDRTTNPENPTRLGLRFQDVTYKLPENMTEAVIEVRGLSTWWNEILAFDDIRVTEGPPTGGGGDEPSISISRNGGNIEIIFTGVLEQSLDLPGGWEMVETTGSPHTIEAASQEARAFFRARQ